MYNKSWKYLMVAKKMSFVVAAGIHKSENNAKRRKKKKVVFCGTHWFQFNYKRIPCLVENKTFKIHVFIFINKKENNNHLELRKFTFFQHRKKELTGIKKSSGHVYKKRFQKQK